MQETRGLSKDTSGKLWRRQRSTRPPPRCRGGTPGSGGSSAEKTSPCYRHSGERADSVCGIKPWRSVKPRPDQIEDGRSYWRNLPSDYEVGLGCKGATSNERERSLRDGGPPIALSAISALPCDDYFAETLIFWVFATSVFGRATVRTPSAHSAVTWASLMGESRSNPRENEPQRRPTRW